MGRVAITIDDEIHDRARAMQIRDRGVWDTWEAWVEDAIREKAEHREAYWAEQDRKRRGKG